MERANNAPICYLKILCYKVGAVINKYENSHMFNQKNTFINCFFLSFKSEMEFTSACERD